MSEKQVVSHSVTYRTADENDDGQRLDNYLARILKGCLVACFTESCVAVKLELTKEE